MSAIKLEQNVVNQKCVTMLEGMLERARKGEIYDAAVVAGTSDGGTTTEFTNTYRQTALIGALRYLEHRLLQNLAKSIERTS